MTIPFSLKCCDHASHASSFSGAARWTSGGTPGSLKLTKTFAIHVDGSHSGPRRGRRGVKPKGLHHHCAPPSNFTPSPTQRRLPSSTATFYTSQGSTSKGCVNMYLNCRPPSNFTTSSPNPPPTSSLRPATVCTSQRSTSKGVSTCTSTADLEVISQALPKPTT